MIAARVLRLSILQLFQQLDKLLSRQARTLDERQREPTPQIAVMQRHDDTCIISISQQHNMTACLMNNGKTCLLQCTDHLARCHYRQTWHQAAPTATLKRPMCCSSKDSIGMGSSCFRKLAQ